MQAKTILSSKLHEPYSILYSLTILGKQNKKLVKTKSRLNKKLKSFITLNFVLSKTYYNAALSF